jgi:transposase-like protein
VSAREQARSQILADALDAAADSGISRHTENGSGVGRNAEIKGGDRFAEFSIGIDGETPFYGENAVSKTERVEAARKPDFGNGNEETHSSVPAGETAFPPGTRSHAESVHSPAEHTGNRSTFSGNKSSYSAAADGARNNTFKESGTPHAAIASNESRAAYTVQPTDEDWNGAAETGASYTSVHSREDGSISRKSGHSSSSDHGNASGKTEPMPTPEQEEAARLERMNANYEHDKAVLAKADPMFARNQFWDVGHAEGSGEESDREIKRATKKLQENMLEKIKGKQL